MPAPAHGTAQPWAIAEPVAAPAGVLQKVLDIGDRKQQRFRAGHTRPQVQNAVMRVNELLPACCGKIPNHKKSLQEGTQYIQNSLFSRKLPLDIWAACINIAVIICTT